MRTWLVLAGLCLAFAAPPASAIHRCGNGIVEEDEQCDDGNLFGGDGCAFNCTTETLRRLVLDPDRAFAATQLAAFRVEFPLDGTIRVRVGDLDENGSVPIVLRRDDLTFEPTTVPGLTCSCVSVRNTPRLFGPGNAGFGEIRCGEGQGFLDVPTSVRIRRDHNTEDEDPECRDGTVEPPESQHPGVCNGPFVTQTQGNAGEGALGVLVNILLRLINDGGTCSIDPDDPAKGPDGIPCSDDDPVGDDDPAQILVIEGFATTETISAQVLDANNALGVDIGPDLQCGAQPCQVDLSGEKVNCDALLADRNAPINEGEIVLAFPSLDARNIGDAVVTARLVPLENPPPDCAGDCSVDGRVTVNELVQGVNIALGNLPVSACPEFDQNADTMVTVNELIAAVRNALEGCG